MKFVSILIYNYAPGDADYYVYLTLQSTRRLFLSLRFVPSIEFDIAPHLAFLPENLDVMLQKVTPVPLLTGLNDFEGLIFAR